MKYTLMDIALAGLMMCLFATFHHVIPRWFQSDSEPREQAVSLTEQEPLTQDVPSEAQTEETPEQKETKEEQDLNGKTEWQIRFADRFTENVIQTDSVYSSPNLYVSFEKHEEERDGNDLVYYLADIYVSSLDCVRSVAAAGDFTRNGAADAGELAEENKAVLLVNGDYYTTRRSALLIRNGIVYNSNPSESDICVLYPNGEMKAYTAGEYDEKEIAAEGPYQVWRFGPKLLDENGCALTGFSGTPYGIQVSNPRTAIGYYEPGHYCLLVSEGRSKETKGVDLATLAEIFEELGCREAFNLDGGASSVFVFDGELINNQSKYRKISDGIILCEPEGEQ